MDLSALKPVYEHEGPFATVYMEGRSPGEDSGDQVRLRWRALRERLEAAGAETATVDAIENELRKEPPGEEQTDGRVLVATGSTVVLDAPWDAALGAGDDAHYDRLPDMAPYMREKARSVRELVVLADQEGAQVRQEVIAEQHDPREVAADTVSGSAVEGVHKPREGGLSHNQIQRRADEAVGRNAQDIADHIRTVAKTFRPRVLVLAGEVQARTAVREQLSSPLSDILVETDRGGRDEHASDEALADELLRIAGQESARAARQRTEELEHGLAHEQAVQGKETVAKAAEMGAVSTLLFERDASAARDAFLLKSCAETGAQFDLVAADTELTDGVGALLRFPLTG